MAEPHELEPNMDPNGLYREDLFTDQKVGTIRQLTPVRSDGSADPARPMLFVGQTQIMTNAGLLPLSFEIPGASLADAVRGYGEAAKQALQETVAELQELRRQAASQLVIPDAGTASAILGAGGQPARGGPGSKIRMP